MRDELIFFVEPVLENATLVAAFEGWNDAGEAATGAARYVEAAIHAFRSPRSTARILRLHRAPPVDAHERDGTRAIDWPPVTRVSYGPCDVARELVVAIGVEPHLRWRTYCDVFTSLVRRLRRAAGRAARRVRCRCRLFAPGRRHGLCERGRSARRDRRRAVALRGADRDRRGARRALRADGVPVLSLWAGLPHYISASPNPRGSLALVQKLASDLPLAIDEAPLRGEAAAFEQRISALVSGDPELSEYVRLLKRREFAQ